ncbi:hypothetical protein GCM10007147_10680 [Nocardiopsis kunsanensis]|uniref:Uncharacterized protein n=1 Tax=Nocardiopsis kunsanensis TaxID=141693 RepID=A0A918X9L3_9ACTN|nr:hypothetical protein GCM10007147_10680 [Nocardiopsis kunsanensis]
MAAAAAIRVTWVRFAPPAPGRGARAASVELMVVSFPQGCGARCPWGVGRGVPGGVVFRCGRFVAGIGDGREQTDSQDLTTNF